MRTTTSSTSWPRGLIGTNNVDTNPRLCMSSAVAGWQADPRCRRSTLLLCRPRLRQPHPDRWRQPAVAHPIVFAASRTPGPGTRILKIVVIDPGAAKPPPSPTFTCPCGPAPTSRCTTRCCTSCSAKIGWIGTIAAHTSGFEDLAAVVGGFHPRRGRRDMRPARRRYRHGRPLVRHPPRRPCPSTARASTSRSRGATTTPR